MTFLHSGCGVEGQLSADICFFRPRLIRQTDEETTRLYVGIFGVVLMFLSLQKAYEMVRIALAKRHSQDK